MAAKKGQNSKLPRLPSVFKTSWRITPKSNHGKLRDCLNCKITELFSRIGEVSRKKSTSSLDELSTVTIEGQFPKDERLSSEDDILSQEINEKYPTETVELPTETEKHSPEIGAPFQRVETSPVIFQEISPKVGNLGEESKTVAIPQKSPSNRELRKFCPNTPCGKKYYFLLDQGVQLTDAAKELSDEKMNLLWEDIFKPLDFCSILHDRRRQLSSNSEIETNMQNLFSII